MSYEFVNFIDKGVRLPGIILSVSDYEVVVEIGYKYCGYCPKSYFLTDLSRNLSDCVTIGDKMEFIVVKINNNEGTVLLESVKHMEARKKVKEEQIRKKQQYSQADKIIEQVRQELLAMKPVLMKEMIQTATELLQEQIQQLHAENQELRQRIAQLENIIDKLK